MALVDLSGHVVGQLVRVHNAVSSRIHQFEITLLDLDQGADPVARNPSRGLDDADHLARQGIEQATLAHIGSAYNGNGW